MNQEKITDILLNLSSVSGVTGSEDAAVKETAAFFKQFVDQVKKDRFGNLLALKKSNAAEKHMTIALVAHIDEIGFVVSKIEEGGFLRFSPLNRIDARVLPGQAVEIESKEVLKGVIGSTPPHLLSDEERKKIVPIDKLFIDLGIPEEKVRNLVSVGDTIKFAQQPLAMNFNNKLTGKSLDNRAGIAALVYAASELSGLIHTADIYFIASLQEEVGFRGAFTAAYGLKPDLAIVVDVTFGDSPGLKEGSYFELGKGPTLAVGPNLHPILTGKIEETARANYLPCQKEPIPGSSSTDAWAFQVSRAGIPTALLSVPLRYMHTPVEMVDLEDIIACGKIISSFCSAVNADFLEVLKTC